MKMFEVSIAALLPNTNVCLVSNLTTSVTFEIRDRKLCMLSEDEIARAIAGA